LANIAASSGLRVRVLGVPLIAQPYTSALAQLERWARSAAPSRVHFCTVHSIVEAQSNVALRSAFESADVVATDGVPLVWVVRRRGARMAERVCGPDIMLSLCDQGRSSGLRHFFLGGRAGVPEQLADRMRERFPGLIVVGTESPPFRELTAEEDLALVERINAVQPNVVWVGLGSPKQELWAAEHQDRLHAGLIVPVGAAFDFHSGRVRRAPRWMQRVGLEWLFRLAMDPRRLFTRYVVTNSKFVILLIREELGLRTARP
jgi:N-acetylglucosaminyldiphosphoundecaprenol N-acetyl-beta-D-mannosaminyltransferase